MERYHIDELEAKEASLDQGCQSRPAGKRKKEVQETSYKSYPSAGVKLSVPCPSSNSYLASVYPQKSIFDAGSWTIEAP
eukprot:scaffold17680_cov67-Skeletonema_dohrnii-CCMP3373.AAC.1